MRKKKEAWRKAQNSVLGKWSMEDLWVMWCIINSWMCKSEAHCSRGQCSCCPRGNLHLLSGVWKHESGRGHPCAISRQQHFIGKQKETCLRQMEKVKKRTRKVQNHGSKVSRKLHERELPGFLQNFSGEVWTPQLATLSPSLGISLRYLLWVYLGFGYISPVVSLTAPWPAESRAWKLRTEHFIRIFNKFSVKRWLVTHWENYYNKVWW